MSKKQPSQRARNSEAKTARRHHILAESFKLFAKQDFDSISMDGLAKKAGLAKGTLYLYFQTKEEVFLSCTQKSFGDWILDLTDLLNSQPGTLSSAQVAEAFTVSLQKFPELPRLLSHLHVVLEKNISEAAARDFKIFLKSQLVKLAETLSGRTRSLPNLEITISFLLKSYSLLVGLFQVCTPHPRIQKILNEPELSIFRLSFEDQLKESLALLLAGFDKLENKNTYHLFGNY